MNQQTVRIDPVRRHYNKWVSNEVLEDYALRFTATRTRRWTCGQVANTAAGASSFLALEAIGAAITLQYGFDHALAAIAVVCSLIFLVGIPIAYHAVRAGVDIDLLTRGAGFGYLGSTITSLIYASFTFIFFAIEAAIMATALEVCFGVPLNIGYVLSALLVIPVVLYGITAINRFQQFTQVLWIGLQLLPFVALAWIGGVSMHQWTAFPGLRNASGDLFSIIYFGAASAVVFSLIAQIGEQVDYLRFLPPRTAENRRRWWAALIIAGPGWIVFGALKMLAGSLLVVLAFDSGVPANQAGEPVYLYFNAYTLFVPPEVALVLTGLFVIVCQLKINVTNSYAGSIAWSNFFSRITHSHPGRVVWLVFNIAIALMLMELGVYKTLENTLSLYSIVAVAWIGALASDLAINKSLGLSPRRIEFKRAHLYDINPVGTGAMILSCVVAMLSYSGVWGPTVKALSSYLALGLAMALVPLLALLTRGQIYIARESTLPADRPGGAHELVACVLCENCFDASDMAQCPAYGRPICSLCCTLDHSCEDACRRNARLPAQLKAVLERILPRSVHLPLERPVVRYLSLLTLVGTFLLLITYFVYLESTKASADTEGTVYLALRNLFAVLFIAAGVFTWIFLLISDSHRSARREIRLQNTLLLKEIKAHEHTERELQRAKETAEAASFAKSRYLMGLSHELRSPLSAILGYAQLIDERPSSDSLPHANGIRVIRESSKHLSGLIESLLDISRIEAGRFAITRQPVDLPHFLQQLEAMFQLQAEAQGLHLQFDLDEQLPGWVKADEKRLRQVLINLLGNAIRCTPAGTVGLRLSYSGQVERFDIHDTGVGIESANIQRIFEPFESIGHVNGGVPRGSGLGLTISKLLTEVMGGELTVTSTPGIGTTFSIRMLLSATAAPECEPAGSRAYCGYSGPRRTIVVVDDDPNHRTLMRDYLGALGFTVRTYADAEHCLSDAISAAHARSIRADAYLLDIGLPGMDGWTLARQLRTHSVGPVAIIMVSANTDMDTLQHSYDRSTENYFVKPVDLERLVVRLQLVLGFSWVAQEITPRGAATPTTSAGTTLTLAATQSDDQWSVESLPTDTAIHTLQQLNRIGWIVGIQNALQEIRQQQPESAVFVDRLHTLLQGGRLDEFDRVLKAALSLR